MARKYRHYPHVLVVDTCVLMHEQIIVPKDGAYKICVPQAVHTELMYLAEIHNKKYDVMDLQARQALDALIAVESHVRNHHCGHQHWWSICGSHRAPEHVRWVLREVPAHMSIKLSPEDKVILAQAYQAKSRAKKKGMRATLLTRDRMLLLAGKELGIHSISSWHNLPQKQFQAAS